MKYYAVEAPYSFSSEKARDQWCAEVLGRTALAPRAAEELHAATGNGRWPTGTVLADVVEEWATRYDDWTPGATRRPGRR